MHGAETALLWLPRGGTIAVAKIGADRYLIDRVVARWSGQPAAN
jgi:hypothetical protein